MIELSDYDLSAVHRGSGFVLYRGRHLSSDVPILVRAAATEEPGPALVSKLEHEWSWRRWTSSTAAASSTRT